MVENIQGKMENIGKSGCYFLCLLYVTNNLPNALPLYDKFVDKCYMDKDCFIRDPLSIMRDLTGKKYNVFKSEKFEKTADVRIAYFYNKTTGLHHFVVVDKYNTVQYDPLGASNTVKNGVVESYRLFFEV
jgi:hypothetical protein